MGGNELDLFLQPEEDELTKTKRLFEQAKEIIAEKDKRIVELTQAKDLAELKLYEANAHNYKISKDLDRMAEMETRDISRLKSEIIDKMDFTVTLDQAKMIGGKTLFAEQFITLKFNGNTGQLIKSVTDTEDKSREQQKT